ncbi:dicarboxylate/amino acid:cation symporter [Mesoplasma seiffertii]|uniref:dicarboxylate/amino acid:cation symporter n=1 Tax=Mesoplasma seiffertii TaxID=28224 RepID=UPI00047BB38D|nr:dicarboxylate/amino acid:cation symporter [Mesoplasma seiffertii]
MSGFRETFLEGFLSISMWQSFLTIFIFFGVMGGFYYGLRKIKIKFVYRVLIGMSLGLTAGIIIQAIIGFPVGEWFAHSGEAVWAKVDGNWVNLSGYYINDGDKLVHITSTNMEQISQNWNLVLNSLGDQVFQGVQSWNVDLKNGIKWVGEFNIWASMLKQVFINGILLITIPVVFIAIFRVVAKPGSNRLGSISAKGIAILLLFVAIAFTITFWIGYFLNIGGKLNFDNQVGSSGRTDSKPLPEIIWGYLPSNIIATFSGVAIIPVIVLAALFGQATKYVRKKHPESMDNLNNFMDRSWDIIMSILMTFLKIMPLAVMSMFATAITTRPIGALQSIGMILLVGYLGLIIMLGVMTFVLFVNKVNIKVWWKHAWKPLVQGFSTQSSNATLPVTIDTLTNEMKIKPEVASVVASISTSMGLVACAGVQAGLITSVLYTGSVSVAADMNLFAFFILALFTTVVASIGIAGIPGTATVVTSAVLNGMGFGIYFAPVYAIFGAIDGLFDMGRTATNVTGGVFASTLVAKNENMFEEDTELITKEQYSKKQAKLLKRQENKANKKTQQTAKR